MNSLFENAKFGDKFKRRDGKMALFINGDYMDGIVHEKVYQFIQDDNLYFVYADGLANKQIIDNPKDIVFRWEDDDALALFKTLPHLDGNYNIVDDWGYTPNLYHFDTQWFVDWIHCEEGDSLLSYSGKTPEEAIMKACTIFKTLSSLNH